MIQGQTLSFHPIRLSLSLLPRLVDAPSRTAWALPASFHPSVPPTRPFQLLAPLTSQPYRRESPSPCRGPGYIQVRTTQHVHFLTVLTIRLLSATLSLLSLSCSPTFYPRESLFRVVPATIYRTYSPTFTFRPCPRSSSSHLGLVLSALTPSLSDHVAPPFSRIRLSHSLSSRLPFWPAPALLP